MKNRTKVIDYAYIVDEKNKTIIETESMEHAIWYAKAFNKMALSYFPYADYGYEDPYNFTNDWTVIGTDGNVVKYSLSYAGIEEVAQ